MSGIERGLRNASIESVVKIARGLEVPVGTLFEWVDDEPVSRAKSPRSAGRSAKLTTKDGSKRGRR